MPNILSLTNIFSATIADIQATANKLYAATGVSEIATGTVYNAPAGTITNGDTYEEALGIIAGKFDAATGHFHTGAAGDGPLLNVVRSLQAGTGGMPMMGDLMLVAGANMSITPSASGFLFASTGSGAATGGGVDVITFAFANNQSTFADITGFTIDPTLNASFVADTSVERLYNEVIQAENTAIQSNVGTGFTGFGGVSCLIQPDGKILIVGAFTQYNGGSVGNGIIRLNSDGSVDTAFQTNIGTGINSGSVNCVALDSTLNIYFGGSFTSFNGTTSNRVAKLDSTGVLDTTFSTNIGTGATGSSPQIASIAIQGNGQILLGGNFTAFNGSSPDKLARLNTDGTVDTTFATNIGSGGQGSGGINITGIGVQADQKIVLVGGFTQFNGSGIPFLMRLNTDGTTDSAFMANVGTSFNGVSIGVLIQPDQQILVGGSFTSYNGTSSSRIARLNPDGTIESTFTTNIGTGSNGTLRSFGIFPDASIIVAATSMTSFNGTSCGNALVLNPDGTIDTDYAPYYSTGFPGGVSTMSVSTSSNYLILNVGDFPTFNGNSRPGIIEYGGLSSFHQGSYQTIKGDYNPITSTWLIEGFDAGGDMTGMNYQLLNTGQMQYTSSDNAGIQLLNQMKFSILGL